MGRTQVQKAAFHFVCVAGKFITVGWGKKETQFHGSEGKQAAQKKVQVGDKATFGNAVVS